MTPETTIQRDIMNAARAMGLKAYRINSGKVRVKGGWMELAEEGTPDVLIMLRRGLDLWVEVKQPGEEPSVIQRLRHRELRNLGHAVTVSHSVDEFLEALKEVAA